MFSCEENALLTRVGPGTAMGNLMRRYWIPAKTKNASTRLSINAKTHMHSIFFPFVASINSGLALRFSKGERRAFLQIRSLLRFAAPRDLRFCCSRIVVLITALLLSAISTFAQSSSTAKLQKVTALYGARSGASWPMWMAKDGG